MEGIGSTPYFPENNYGYNGIEELSDFDLDVSHATYRTLDPAIGRWWQVDPEAESFYGRRGQRFLDGKDKFVTQRYITPTGSTPSVDNPYYSQDRVRKLGEVGSDRAVPRLEMGTDIYKGFEGDLALNGYANPLDGERFFVEADGQRIFSTTLRDQNFNLSISSNVKNVRWGIEGVRNATTVTNNAATLTEFTITANRYDSYLTLTGKHRGWAGFLFWR